MTTNPECPKPRPESLTRSSYAPPLMAVGLMGLLWGVVTTWIVSIAGAVLIGVAAVKWITSLPKEDKTPIDKLK